MMEEDDLTSDVWQDCEDLVTEDLFDFLAESLRHSSGESEGICFPLSKGDVLFLEDDSEPVRPIPMFSPRCCPSLGSCSTLPSLGNLERLSMASTRSSLQSSVRRLSSAGHVQLNDDICLSEIANPASARTVPGSARMTQSARGHLASSARGPASARSHFDTARRKFHTPRHALVSPVRKPDTARSARQKWEDIRVRLDDIESQQSPRGSLGGLSWQQMWRAKIQSTRQEQHERLTIQIPGV